jgi:hypothetical protein
MGESSSSLMVLGPEPMRPMSSDTLEHSLKSSTEGMKGVASVWVAAATANGFTSVPTAICFMGENWFVPKMPLTLFLSSSTVQL